ncbi:MAG TPA: protease pro-enzyme activation domain-containing protein [Steroidobacteraceae bacterium]
MSPGSQAHAASGQYIANSTPAFVTTATKVGAATAAQRIEISLWLKPHNRAAMDALAQQLYDRSSPNYRHWLKPGDITARYAPTAAEAQVVRQFLQAHQLTVSRIGPSNFYVRASGTIAQVEQAFAVQINNYILDGRAMRANSADPYVEGPAAALIQAVSGLDDVGFESPGMQRPTIVAQGQATAMQRLAPATQAPTVSGFQSQCFPGAVTVRRTTSGGYPKATYTGNDYSGSGGGCAYAPADIRAAYNLDALYAEGYDGRGQTIVLVEDCGSPTLLDDANTFSERFGLPLLTPSKFSIISMGTSVCAGYYPNINADVEWAHAIAPGAALAVVYSVSNGAEDVDEAMFYAVSFDLGAVISDDNAFSETLVPVTELQKENLISELAALEGISANYPCGFKASELFFGSPITAPADGPYATAIGGVTLALAAGDSIAFETGWEDHVSEVLAQGTIYDPAFSPVIGGLLVGGLGGPSAYFAKPSFQSRAVAGSQRQQPDFSWVADPYTGLIVVATTGAQEPPQSWFAFGGTDVATSMFSALWAIADQKAGAALGQAAPYLYSLPATAVTDVVPRSSPNDVVATVQETSSTSTRFTAAQTLLVTPPFSPFYSALWQNPDGVENTALVLSFGGDSVMKTAVGWDEVTGMGTPRDAKAFVDWVGGNNQ